MRLTSNLSKNNVHTEILMSCGASEDKTLNSKTKNNFNQLWLMRWFNIS